MAKEQKSPSNGNERCGNYRQDAVDGISAAILGTLEANGKVHDICNCEARAIVYRSFLALIASLGTNGHDQEIREEMHKLLDEHCAELHKLADTLYNEGMGVKLQ